MIHTKDHKTLDMFTPFPFLGPKRKARIEASWAKLFREEVLPVLPVHKVHTYYHKSKGAPTKELYAMLGLLLLQQMHDLTDEEAVDQFAYNIQWHYALNITSVDDTDAYVCPKTLWTMRSILSEPALHAALFESITERLARVFSVDVSKQRIDSVHIFSNMRHLGRIGLFVKTIKKFLINLKRHHKDLYEIIPGELSGRYMTKQGEAIFSMVRPTESMNTLGTLAADVFTLVEQFKDNEPVVAMSSYQLLQRLFREQCIEEHDTATTAPRIMVKANKDVPSDSLQNPSDPDASYDGHKGKGFQVQLSESYSTADKEQNLSLITAVTVEPAHKSDTNALIPLIEAVQKRDIGPDEVLADSLYGSDDNLEKARALGVEVVSPVMGNTPDAGLTLADFTMTDNGKVTACPQGHVPEKTKHKKNRHSAAFNADVCQHCPRLSDCPVKPGDKGYYLRYDNKTVRLAKRRAIEKTEAFRDKYRFRSGIEATMSEYDRKTGVKHLRIRGLSAVSFCATLKAAAVNIFRATAFRNRAQEEKPAVEPCMNGILDTINIFKEQIINATAHVQRLFGFLQPYSRFMAQFAA